MDAGELIGEAAFQRIKKLMDDIYKRLQETIERILRRHLARYDQIIRIKQRQLASGQITKKEYDNWLSSAIFGGAAFSVVLIEILRETTKANEEVTKVINKERYEVYAENASYSNYMAYMAGIPEAPEYIYDRATVENLVSNYPNLLPAKVLDPTKDAVWNKHKINMVILHGILYGESIEKIAKKLAETTASTNRSQMLRTARTAMTSAQNAGRVIAMQDQQKKGITVQKLWIATLDDRTRDSHADLDGKTADVDEPFHSILGDIKFPGDPDAKPANVYNCRCSLGCVYPGHPMKRPKRRDNITKELIDYVTYKEWKQGREAISGDQLIELVENREREQGAVTGG